MRASSIARPPTMAATTSSGSVRSSAPSASVNGWYGVRKTASQPPSTTRAPPAVASAASSRDEPALARSGLAADEHHPPSLGRAGRDERLERVQLVRTSDEGKRRMQRGEADGQG